MKESKKPDQPISAEEFSNRLAALCLSGSAGGFPKKQRDRFILLRSALQSLDRSRKYNERDLKDSLQNWLQTVAHRMEIDHVTIRRALVDEGYLIRTSDGATYSIELQGRGQMAFEPAVADIDSRAVVADAELRAIERRRAFKGEE